MSTFSERSECVPVAAMFLQSLCLGHLLTKTSNTGSFAMVLYAVVGVDVNRKYHLLSGADMPLVWGFWCWTLKVFENLWRKVAGFSCIKLNYLHTGLTL
jgi:hypothetical protein